MFYDALISLHHCNNDDNIEHFRSIAIYLNYVFLLILASPVTGDPHGIQTVLKLLQIVFFIWFTNITFKYF
jgi:hypothetical protein